MSICNYSSLISETFAPPINFLSNQLEIDTETLVNKIGWVDKFIDVDSITFHRIVLEENRNGSYKNSLNK